jgi:undecaprenyl diphosphate synthase
MEERTVDNTGLKFNLAVSYGARDDIAQATRRCVQDVQNGSLAEQLITQEEVSKVVFIFFLILFHLCVCARCNIPYSPR